MDYQSRDTGGGCDVPEELNRPDEPRRSRTVDRARKLRLTLAALQDSDEQFAAVILDIASDTYADGAALSNVYSLLASDSALLAYEQSGRDYDAAVADLRHQLVNLEAQVLNERATASSSDTGSAGSDTNDERNHE